ncbi:MAG: acetyltransferase [Acidimicrobiales bacterium]
MVTIAFRPLETNDFPVLVEWFAEPAIAQWWNQTAELSADRLHLRGHSFRRRLAGARPPTLTTRHQRPLAGLDVLRRQIPVHPRRNGLTGLGCGDLGDQLDQFGLVVRGHRTRQRANLRIPKPPICEFGRCHRQLSEGFADTDPLPCRAGSTSATCANQCAGVRDPSSTHSADSAKAAAATTSRYWQSPNVDANATNSAPSGPEPAGVDPVNGAVMVFVIGLLPTAGRRTIERIRGKSCLDRSDGL